MIGIKANGTFLDIFPDTSINLKLANPIFADDNLIPGSFSLPFEIPGGDDSGDNAEIINHPDVVENIADRFEIADAELHIDGLLYKKGTLFIEEADANRYRANFRFSIKNIRSDFKTFKIRDLVDEDITITAVQYNKKVVAKYGAGVTAPYKLIVNGDTYEGLTLTLLASAINAVSGLTAIFTNTGSTFGVSGDRVEVEPSITPGLVSQVFNVKLETSQDIVGSDITSDPMTAFLTAYATWLDAFYGVSPINDYLLVPMVRNFVTNKIDEYINRVTATGYDFGRLTDVPQKGVAYVPYVTLKRVFDTISTEFGITFSGSFFADTWYPKALFYHTYKNWQDLGYIKGEEYRFYNEAFNVKDLVPDITIEELLKGLQTKFNLSVIISDNGKEISMNRRGDMMLSKASIDWTDISGPVGPINYKDTVDGVKLESAIDGNDDNDEPDTYIYGNAEKTISSIIGSIHDDQSIDGFDMPMISQEYGTDFIPRLFFYQGEGDNAGLTYQEASYKGMEVKYGGTGALGESQWKNYLRFLTSRKMLPVTINLEYRHLNVIDWEQKIMIDGTTYLIKTIDVKISSNGIEPAEVELYKI